MEIHSAEITKVYKSDIILKKINKKLLMIRNYSVLALLILPILALACLKIFSGTELNGIYKNACNLYNPIYSPFVETGNMTFAWNYTFSNDINDFDLPIVSSDITVLEDGTIIAKVKESIMVKSVADGVVTKIEEKDGVKSVTIAYSNDLSVKYVNIDVLGVNEGNIVERGKQIGTAKIGEEMQFKAYMGDKQLNSFKIENNKIIWQN